MERLFILSNLIKHRTIVFFNLYFKLLINFPLHTINLLLEKNKNRRIYYQGPPDRTPELRYAFCFINNEGDIIAVTTSGQKWRAVVIQASCTVPIAKNLFRGQPFEGINFSGWKGNANIPLLAVPRILMTIPPAVTPHTCMVSTGCPFFFCNFFASLYVSPNRCIPSNQGR